MNAVEDEDAISTHAGQHFNPSELPFTFLEAFGNKPTTIKRLRTGSPIEFNPGDGKAVSSSYADTPRYFGFSLLLAATSSEWGIAERRHDRQQKLPAWFSTQSLFGIGGYYVLA